MKKAPLTAGLERTSDGFKVYCLTNLSVVTSPLLLIWIM